MYDSAKVSKFCRTSYFLIYLISPNTIYQLFMNRNIFFDDTFKKCGKPNLYLLGGIQINMPKPMPDFFMPLMFEERNANGTVTDLMESTFGSAKKEAWV